MPGLAIATGISPSFQDYFNLTLPPAGADLLLENFSNYLLEDGVSFILLQ